MYNCDIYADVDFGRGSVEVRCTETGEHTIHRCVVALGVFDPPKAANVFEKKSELLGRKLGRE